MTAAQSLAAYRLRRAQNTWRDGMTLLENESYESALNRFYYAAFYAARALLATKALDAQKHSGVITLFQQHFVKTGQIDTQVAKALARSFERRLDIDYEDFATADDELANSIAEHVRKFIDTCAKWLQSHGEPPAPPKR